MGEPKAFASLSSGLLARKGAARPAMRPQGFGQVGSGLDDLGWNDMGFEAPKPALAPVRDEDHDAFGEELPEPARASRQRTRAAPGSKSKAAFTLRLDGDRHLKLRLACAVTGRSAQQLVTDALDELLAAMPELDTMAERAPKKRAS